MWEPVLLLRHISGDINGTSILFLFQSPQKFHPVFPNLKNQHNLASVAGYTSMPSASQQPWFRGIETPVESSCELGNVV